MSWKQIGRLIRTMFLLRVPLIALLVLAGLGPFALGGGKQLLGNLFDLRVVDPKHFDSSGHPPLIAALSAWYLFAVSFSAFMLAWTAVSVINLVVHYGRVRFDDPDLDLDQKRPGATFLLGFGCASVLVTFTVLQTPIDHLQRYGMPLLGLLSSLGLVITAKVVQLALTNPQTTPHPPPYLVFPAYLFPPLERRFDSLYCWHSERSRKFRGRLNGFVQWGLEIFRGAGQGYLVDCDAPAGKLTLRSGHMFAVALSLIAFALYIVIGYYKGRIDDKPAVVPALAFLLLFLIVACWFLGALTFFFDRYRAPMLAILAVLSFATTYAPESDHFYRVERVPGLPPLLRPSALVRDRAGSAHRRLIVVATAGGGIQAAAWTARVLRGLEEACAQPAEAGTSCDLRSSVLAISGVSGGALGAMAYARSFAPRLSRVSADSVVGNAAASAIDEVAWGWTVPDLFRAISPWFRRQYIDRGWALEERWRAVHKLHGADENDATQVNRDVLLSDWAPAPGVTMPALLLNATIVETGSPLVFSTTAFPKQNDRRGLVNFYDLFPERKNFYDIRVNTAVRLSASFPYVSPAARSNVKHPPVPDYHIVDGGYYDNYGVVALLGWLENAIEDSDDQVGVQRDFADVLVLGVRPFPPTGDAKPKPHGWGFQTIAPIDGLLDVRDRGQMARDDNALALFTKFYRTRQINVWRADFVYPSEFDKHFFQNPQDYQGCLEAPLSWKLSLEQLECVDLGWKQFRLAKKSGHEVGCVLDFLRPRDALKKPEPVACNAGDAPSQ